MEENANINNETVEETKDTQANEPEVTDAELVNQIAELKEELRKAKKEKDKASSEAANFKKALRAKQTTEEREQEELAEQKRLADEENENMRKELNHMKAVAAYKDIQEPETIDLLIEAVSESDHSAIATIFRNELDKAIKEAVKAERVRILKESPNVNIGTGDGTQVSLKDFKKMSYTQRVELFNKNPELYTKLAESEE